MPKGYFFPPFSHDFAKELKVRKAGHIILGIITLKTAPRDCQMILLSLLGHRQSCYPYTQ